jgi:Uncharacterized protein conserved in bacteria
MDTQIKLRDFESQILFFNGMYKLPVAPYPTTYYEVSAAAGHAFAPSTEHMQSTLVKRLSNFKHIIQEEIEEVDDIIMSLQLGIRVKKGEVVEPQEAYTELDLLTDLADWLGDISVYCASEMARYGIPLKETLAIIMSSNFSKLGADGAPLYDGRGKVQKGPGYWKPEPQLKAMLEEHIADRAPAYMRDASRKIVWRANE